MVDEARYPIPDDARQRALINPEQYLTMYDASINDPDTFWSEQANEFLDWHTRWQQLTDSDFMKGEARWFVGGKLNACYNCIDRHLPKHADQTAIIWEGDDPEDTKNLNTICKHGNPNVLTKDKGTSKLGQGPIAHSCLIEVELVTDKEPSTPLDPIGRAGAVFAEVGHSEGIILRAIGDVLAVCPPLIIKENEIHELFDRFENTLDKGLQAVK